MFDLAVENAIIVVPGGQINGVLAVRDGRVAAISAANADLTARARIDAGGRVLLPGLVDLHTHLREPGGSHKEDVTSGTSAAARGGFTTVVMQPNTAPPIAGVEEFDDLVAAASQRAVVDYGVSAMSVPARQDEIAGLVRRGAITIEIALGDVPSEWRPPDTGALREMLINIESAGGLAGVYSVDEGLVKSLERRERDLGRADLDAFQRTRPAMSETIALATTLALASETGANVILRQLSTHAGIVAARAARRSGANVTVEVNPHHLFLSHQEAKRMGSKAKVIPSLRDDGERARLWEAVNDGFVDMIGTDHAPHEAAAKAPESGEVWDVAGGLPGLETTLPLLLDAVVEGGLNLVDLARLCSEAPAKVGGLFPRKGNLLPGADADFVIVDLDGSTEVRDADILSKSAWSPFAGRRLRGEVVATYLRGAPVYRDGEVTGATGGGRFLQSLRRAPVR